MVHPELPELVKLVKIKRLHRHGSNVLLRSLCRLLFRSIALLVKDKSTCTVDKLPELTEIIGDEAKAKEVIEAAAHSMGQDISPIDLVNIETFAKRVIGLAEYRQKLHTCVCRCIFLLHFMLCDGASSVISGSLATARSCFIYHTIVLARSHSAGTLGTRCTPLRPT